MWGEISASWVMCVMGGMNNGTGIGPVEGVTKEMSTHMPKWGQNAVTFGLSLITSQRVVVTHFIYKVSID